MKKNEKTQGVGTLGASFGAPGGDFGILFELWSGFRSGKGVLSRLVVSIRKTMVLEVPGAPKGRQIDSERLREASWSVVGSSESGFGRLRESGFESGGSEAPETSAPQRTSAHLSRNLDHVKLNNYQSGYLI